MSRRFFNLASLVLQYILPFTVITYSYTKVWIILSNRTRPGNTKEKEKLDLKRKKRTNRMLISMVVIFAFCWLPLNCVYLIMEFYHEFAKWPYFFTVFFISHAIAMSSTIYNPFLYAWLNDNFRKEFRLILPCFFKLIDYCRQQRKDGSGEPNELVENDEEERFERTRLMNATVTTNMVSSHVDENHGTSKKDSDCTHTQLNDLNADSKTTSLTVTDKNELAENIDTIERQDTNV
jgi:hypothetical protein